MSQKNAGLSDQELAERNRQVVERFFLTMEAQDFEVIKEIFAPEGKQLMPYAPEGYQKSVNGLEAVYKQFSELPSRFSYFRYPRRLYTTDDPNLIFAKFTGEIGLHDGSVYANNYVGTFKMEDGKILEYAEYFNPFIMAKAFDIKL
ncbi:MAG TPA: nuclear transport factor 2 family protein [Pseudosphingobacterium sp.]|nr:nuclear transport factor 2 family protein [Pseudosphingobacterium sp.]